MSKIQNQFSFKDYTYKEFQAFLIILPHKEIESSLLKKSIDDRFGLTSRTKGYDYINNLSKKDLIYKKSIYENGKKQTKIFVNDNVRRNYERFIIPTISDIRLVAKEYLQDKLKELNNLKAVHKKIKNYTEQLIEEIKDLIENTSASTKKKKRFLETIEDRIWTNFKAAMLEYEIFFSWKNKENN